MLHDIGDEDIAAPQAGQREQFVQEFAGGADERAPLAILVEARRLTDEHDLGVGRALTRHGVDRAVVQFAERTTLYVGGDPRQLLSCAHP